MEFQVAEKSLSISTALPHRIDSRPLLKAAALPADFITRTTGALSKITEEHWRRQMREEQKQEEEVWGEEGGM